MGRIIAVVLLLAALAGGAWWLQTSGAFVEEYLEPAAPIDPPPGALIMDEAIKPGAVVMSVVGTPGMDNKEAVADSFVGWWVAERGWDGEAEEVKVTDGVTRFAVELHDTTIVGMCFIVCEVPGGVEGLEDGRLVRFRGRIKEVRQSPDLMSQPHRLYLDQVTVLRVR